MNALARLAGSIFLNPVALKELRTALRRPRFVVIHSLCISLLAGTVLVWLARLDLRRGSGVAGGPPGWEVFLVFFFLMAGVVLLVFPAFATASVVEEKVNKSFDLLVVTDLAPWEIALGKYLAALGLALVYLASTLPVASLCFLFGGVSVGDILLSYLMLVLGAALLLAYTVLVSAMAQTPARAVATTYAMAGMSVLALGAIAGETMRWVSLQGASVTGWRGLWAAWSPSLPPSSPGVVAFVLVGPVLLYLLAWTYFALLTVNRLAPFSANRSTPLRILGLVAVVLGTAGYLAGVSLFLPVLDARDLASGHAVAVGLLATVLASMVVAFSAEEPLRPGRVRDRMLAWTGPLRALRLLYPGGWRGVAYSLGLSAVVLAVLAAAGVGLDAAVAAGGRAPGRGWTVYPSASLCAMAFLFFLSQLSLRSTRVFGGWNRGAGVATAVALALAVTPVVAWGVRGEGRSSELENGLYLSPVLGMVSAATPAWTSEAPSLRLGGVDAPHLSALDQESPPAERASAREQGLPLHLAGTALYALLGFVLLCFNLRAKQGKRGTFYFFTWTGLAGRGRSE